MPIARVLLIVVVCAATGCGAALETSRIQRDFSASFGCPDAQLSPALNGYRVEGCGTTAYYTCIDRSTRSPHREGASFLAEAIVDAVFAGMTADDCSISHVERGPRQPAVVALAEAPRTLPDERAVRSQLPTRGGSIILFGKPGRAPNHVLLDAHAHTRLREGSCEPLLFEDGMRVPVLEHRRVDPYTERMLIPRSALANAKSSMRFAGDVCGFTFELDELTRKSMALFDARFGELAGGFATASR